MAKQFRKLTPEEEEKNRLAERARVEGHYNRVRGAMEASQQAKAAAAARAVEEDPNTPSRRRREAMAQRAPTGYQLMLQALGWQGLKKKK